VTPATDVKAAAVIAYCAAKGYPVPVAEYRFCPGRKYAADLCWPQPGVRCILEFDGAVYGVGKACPVCRRKGGGGHSSVSGILRDIERSTEAALAGWRVLRCTVEDVETGAVYGLVDRLFGSRTE
jgi:hypothetical protein